jgi:pantoate--beta-alanine ligase
VDVEPTPSDVFLRVQQARRHGLTVGCVPTMGALHAGHVSLVERARAECGFVVATIFVNPTQFGPGEDFSRYPRTLDDDLQLCRAAGADLVFTPTAAGMYVAGNDTIVQVCELSKVLEGACRPGHFDGVTTVVARLLNITAPDRAYFGQKDFQQQVLIRRMVQDLFIPVEVITCPIVREPDGLAMSSRNRYLNPEERSRAAQLYQALLVARNLASTTTLSPSEISRAMTRHLEKTGGIEVQYTAVVDAETLAPLSARTGGTGVALIAVRVGTTRLIDNEVLMFPPLRGPHQSA